MALGVIFYLKSFLKEEKYGKTKNKFSRCTGAIRVFLLKTFGAGYNAVQDNAKHRKIVTILKGKIWKEE